MYAFLYLRQVSYYKTPVTITLTSIQSTVSIHHQCNCYGVMHNLLSKLHGWSFQHNFKLLSDKKRPHLSSFFFSTVSQITKTRFSFLFYTTFHFLEPAFTSRFLPHLLKIETKTFLKSFLL